MLIAFVACTLAGSEAAAGSAARRAAAEIERSEGDHAELSEHPLAEAARGEFGLLAAWLEEAREALSSRRPRRAAMLAERLPRQTALIRSLLAIAEDERRIRELDDRAGALRRELTLLRGRLDRIALEREGERATWAYPPLDPAEDGP